jgi:hypothetical protein
MKLRFAMILALSVSGSLLAQSQTAEEQTRQIYLQEFLKARPAGAKKPAAKPAAAKSSTPSKAGIAQLGLTLWKLQPARGTEGARLLVQESSTEFTAAPVDPDAKLSIGDRVRLSIESPRAGYLYVIDREKEADGTLGDPYLIFPTTRTRDGENAVKAGRLIDIPSSDDRPSYFTVKPSRESQVGELLTIIVSPKPLPGITIGEQPLKLSREQVEGWEKSWSAPVERLTMAAAKRLWTRTEQQAAADPTRLLTQEDPAPQSLYRVKAKPGAAVLVNVLLGFK